MVRDVPFSGLYLMFYEHLKNITPQHIKMDHSSYVHFACGITAGFMASLVTQPADVIKTKLQLSPDTKGVVSVIGQVYRQQGLVGFTSGLVPRSLRRTLMAALAWTVYEKMIKSIGLK